MTTMLALLALTLAGPAPQDHGHGMGRFANDADFHRAHTLRETGHVDLKGEMVEIAVPMGAKAKGYFVTPEEEPDRAVLMVHEWWGLNDNIKQTADRLSAEGFAVLAIDLYEGQVATTREDAGKFMAAVDEARAEKVVRAALAALGDGRLASAQGIGAVGYCFGGAWSHRAAILGGESVQACVIYYGMPVMEPSELAQLSAPVLFIWPSKDRWIDRGVRDRFEEAMKSAGRRLTIAEFDADHAFANPSSPNHESALAQDAWKQTIAFFNRYLKSPTR